MKDLRFTNGLFINWARGDNGGGSTQYLDFLDVIPYDARYKRCLEWCAGLSAISFSLLDANIIDEFVAIDIYQPALDGVITNAKNNGIEHKVKVYCIDQIQKLPVTRKFDLVVGNPPHSRSDHWVDDAEPNSEIIRRLTVDQNFKIHKEFFQNITKYLHNNAEIYISATFVHSDIHCLAAADAGLKIINIYPAKELSKDSNCQAKIIYYKYET